MSKTEAIRIATDESSIRFQGGQYILSTYDPAVDCYREDSALPWPVARQALADWRVERALELLGVDEDASAALARQHSRGRVSDRVRAALGFARDRGWISAPLGAREGFRPDEFGCNAR